MSEPMIVDPLRVREKAHTRAGDAVAAARRGLPTGEIDPSVTVVGRGPVPLVEVFVPWYSRRDSGDARLAGRGFEVMAPTHGLRDTAVRGRQETWEDSPAGWPQPRDVDQQLLRTDGRPTARWSRPAGVPS